jgi:hypothetical protein
LENKISDQIGKLRWESCDFGILWKCDAKTLISFEKSKSKPAVKQEPEPELEPEQRRSKSLNFSGFEFDARSLDSLNQAKQMNCDQAKGRKRTRCGDGHSR